MFVGGNLFCKYGEMGGQRMGGLSCIIREYIHKHNLYKSFCFLLIIHFWEFFRLELGIIKIRTSVFTGVEMQFGGNAVSKNIYWIGSRQKTDCDVIFSSAESNVRNWIWLCCSFIPFMYIWINPVHLSFHCICTWPHAAV